MDRPLSKQYGRRPRSKCPPSSVHYRRNNNSHGSFLRGFRLLREKADGRTVDAVYGPQVAAACLRPPPGRTLPLNPIVVALSRRHVTPRQAVITKGGGTETNPEIHRLLVA